MKYLLITVILLAGCNQARMEIHNLQQKKDYCAVIKKDFEKTGSIKMLAGVEETKKDCEVYGFWK